MGNWTTVLERREYIIVYLSRNSNEMVTTRPDLVGGYRYGLVANL